MKVILGLGHSRTCHLDRHSLVSSIKPKCNVISDNNKNSPLYNSFYYRVHLLWNLLPLDIRESESLSTFQSKVLKYLWHSTIEDSDNREGPNYTWDFDNTFQ